MRPSERGKGIGIVYCYIPYKTILMLGRLVDYLINEAKRKGCYKVILNCKEDNVRFYEKCGLKRHGIEMKRYLEE